MRKPVIVGNWKMYKTVADTARFFEQFRPQVENSGHCEIVICPPFPNLPAAVGATKGSVIAIGGQDLSWSSEEGAYTGEVCGAMIRAAGCSHVIVGHSERRRYFAETDEIVSKKTVAALDTGLTPVVCVGETLDQRESGQTEAVLFDQCRGWACGLTPQQFSRILIAYEPVWAIGTGKTATSEIAAAAHRVVRSYVRGVFGPEAADNLRILYGGSVKANNVKDLLAHPEIDGALVGGASLDPLSFSSIVNY